MRPDGLRLVSACVLALWCGAAFADGKYFQEVAFAKAPDMPAQRALIRFKDGRETLIIEAAVDSESKGLGWVIPLPAVPEKMEKVEPGLFESLSFCLRPRVTHDLGPGCERLGFLFCIVLFFVVALASTSKLRRSLGYALVPVLALLIHRVAVPGLLGAAGTPAARVPGIEVAAEKRVGDYDATVLRAEDADALNSWLEANGFAALNSEEKNAVSDYVRDGWCFFAAKLAREEGGESFPHPIAFEFPAAEAVYPVKLTGLAGTSPYFEVFAVGSEEAGLPHLHTALCDRLTKADDGLWRAENVGAAIGHPALEELLWNGCVVTRFAGTLAPEQMKEDVTLGWKPARPRRDRFFSARGARHVGFITFFLTGTASLLVACAVRRKDFSSKKRRRWSLLAILISLAASALVGAVAFAVLPRREVRTSKWFLPMVHRSKVLRVVSEATEDEEPRDAAGLSGMMRREIERMTRKHPDELENPFLGGRVREEASPGNYEVREEEGGPRVYYYDEFARPERLYLERRSEER